jgi:hypothetical protein
MPKKVVGAKADANGNISAVRFQGNAGFTSVDTAIRMAERGQVANAHAVQHPNGGKYLRSNPDGKTGNNLDTLAGDR